MDNDDVMVGRILTRREVLALFGTAGALALVGCGPTSTGGSGSAAGTPTLNAEAATAVAMEGTPTMEAAASEVVATVQSANATTVPGCVVRPAVTEGPYFVDVMLDRSDIRSDPDTGEVRAGVPLALTFNVSQVSASSCAPLAGAVVDVWHCDALGDYSAVNDPGFDTSDQKWLRGFQTTDANGVASFTTIYPGWYSGRTVHIHFKVRTDPASEEGYEFTSQLFFDESLSAQLFTQEPYLSNGAVPDTPNSSDSIYQELLLLAASQSGDGYAATFDIGLDLSVEPQEIGGPGGQGGPGEGGPPPDGTRGPRPEGTPGEGGPGGPLPGQATATP